MIYALTPDGSEVLGIIENYSSFIYADQYYGAGDFQLVTYPNYLDLLLPGTLLVKEKDKKGDRADNVAIIEKVTVDYNRENGNRVTATGRSLKALLYRRIVWKQTNLSGTVEDGIRKIVTDNAITPADDKRALPLRLAEPKGLTDTFEAQLFGENVGDWIETTCKQYGYGWRVYVDDGFVFELYKGAERTYDQGDPVIFSPDFDNLNTAKYTTGNDNNVALVGGEGEGTQKKTAEVGTASGLDRLEVYVDGSSVSSNGEIITPAKYIELLQNYGADALTQQSGSTSLESEVDPRGAFRLGVDYFIGDKVQIDLRGVYASCRLIEIIYSEDETGERVLPTFAEWEV